MKKQTAAVIDEIKENIRRDRKCLEELLSKISCHWSSDKKIDVYSMQSLVEGATKITDSLAKGTAQLVEIAKLQSKSTQGDGKLSDDDRESIMSEIETSSLS